MSLIVTPDLGVAKKPKTTVAMVGALRTHVYEDPGFHRSPREPGAATAMGVVTLEESVMDLCEIVAGDNQLVQALLREVVDLRAQIEALSNPKTKA